MRNTVFITIFISLMLVLSLQSAESAYTTKQIDKGQGFEYDERGFWWLFNYTTYQTAPNTLIQYSSIIWIDIDDEGNDRYIETKLNYTGFSKYGKKYVKIQEYMRDNPNDEWYTDPTYTTTVDANGKNVVQYYWWTIKNGGTILMVHD